MSNRYDTNTQNTSKYMQDLINEFNKMPKGAFDETRRKTLDVGLYDIVPLECWEMLPNSEAYVAYDIQMLTKNPTIKRLLSSMKAEIRVYKCNYNDLWNGWNNFITKGRSGKVSKSIPQIDWSLGRTGYTTSLPYNPAFYLNLAPAVYASKDNIFAKEGNKSLQPLTHLQSSGLTGSIPDINESIKISALPFVMYNKIAKKYQSPNLLQDNPYWYPENEDHDQYLPYDCPDLVTTSDYYNPNPAATETSTFTPNEQKDTDGNYTSRPWLNVLWKAQRKGDYFNTGSPFPDLIRGDVPTLSLLNASLTPIEASLDFSRMFYSYVGGQFNAELLALAPQIDSITTGHLVNSQAQPGTMSLESDGQSIQRLREAFSRAKVDITQPTLKGLQFSMRQWRQLATMTVMRERMALTDGSYNQLIKAMFGHNPKWHDHDVVYCGGYSQPIVFSEVINTASSETNPLGEMAGRGFTSQQGQTIHITSDDFGMFMTVLVITGDDVYSQGIDRMFSRLSNSEQYFPILNNLSPDATLNKELFISGDNAKDNDVFNYQERFAYYKSRRNQVSGLMALPIPKVGDVGAY